MNKINDSCGDSSRSRQYAMLTVTGDDLCRETVASFSVDNRSVLASNDNNNSTTERKRVSMQTRNETAHEL